MKISSIFLLLIEHLAAGAFPTSYRTTFTAQVDLVDSDLVSVPSVLSRALS